MAIAAQDPERPPITRAEYEELVRRGALDEARVELIEGRIVSMSPIGQEHVYSVSRLARLLIQALGDDRAQVRVQGPLIAPNESEPEPDVAVVAPGDYLDAHPQTALLVIEVAESSLSRDRDKARLFAAAGVTEYWIVNLRAGCVEVYREPGAQGYAKVTRHARGDVLRPLSFEDVSVAVADILPPAR
jgi:Uma2 family endonuclease